MGRFDSCYVSLAALALGVTTALSVGCFSDVDPVQSSSGTENATATSAGSGSTSTTTGSSSESSEASSSSPGTTAASSSTGDDSSSGGSSSSTGILELSCFVWDFEDGEQPFDEVGGVSNSVLVDEGNLVVSFAENEVVSRDLVVDPAVDFSAATLEVRGLSSLLAGQFIRIRAINADGDLVSVTAETAAVLANKYESAKDMSSALGDISLPAEFDGLRLEIVGASVAALAITSDGAEVLVAQANVPELGPEGAFHLSFGVFDLMPAVQLSVGQVESCVL